MLSNPLRGELLCLNEEEIHEAWRLLQQRHNELNAAMARNFTVGEKVSFTMKKGGIVAGTIIKINQQRVKVKTDAGIIWNVGPLLLIKGVPC